MKIELVVIDRKSSASAQTEIEFPDNDYHYRKCHHAALMDQIHS